MFLLCFIETFLKGSLIDPQKGGTDMIIKEKKQTDDKRSDLFIWVAACVLMAWIVFIGFITQAR